VGCKEAILCAVSLNTRVYKSLVGLYNTAVWCICKSHRKKCANGQGTRVLVCSESLTP
jgi:hypothetical protein